MELLVNEFKAAPIATVAAIVGLVAALLTTTKFLFPDGPTSKEVDVPAATDRPTKRGAVGVGELLRGIYASIALTVGLAVCANWAMNGFWISGIVATALLLVLAISISSLLIGHASRKWFSSVYHTRTTNDGKKVGYVGHVPFREFKGNIGNFIPAGTGMIFLFAVSENVATQLATTLGGAGSDVGMNPVGPTFVFVIFVVIGSLFTAACAGLSKFFFLSQSNMY